MIKSLRAGLAVSSSLVTGFLLAGCASTSHPIAPQSSSGTDHGLSIQTPAEIPVRSGRVEDVFLLTGELHSVHSLDLVTPRSDAWNVQIKWVAEDGAQVKEGDRVIEFDNTAIAQGIEEKKLRLIQAEIELVSREATLAGERAEKRFAFDSAKSARRKAEIEAAVPADLREMRDWQDKQASLKKAQAAEEKARLELESFEVSARSDLQVLRIAQKKAAREVQSAKRDLDALAIMAPRSGILVVGNNFREDRKFQLGDTVWPGMTIASIPDLSEMEIIGSLPDVDEGRIHAGMKIRCILDTYSDRVYDGMIEEVAAIGEEAGRRSRGGFRVRASLERSEPALMRPGMSVRVEVIRRVWENALIIPRQAVEKREGKSSVVMAGGKRKEVRLAGCTPTECVIEDGIAAGDRLAMR